jgi:membrane-associated phospholipid phosphatase
VTHKNIHLTLCLSVAFLFSSCIRSLAQTSIQTSDSNLKADVLSPLPDAPEPQQSNPTAAKPSPTTTEPEKITLAGTPRRFLFDQKAIWTSPFHIRSSDGLWLVPLTVGTGLLLGSDQHSVTQAIHINATDQQRASNVSDVGLATLGALPAGMYLWSLNHYAPQAHETALLTGEALANAVAVSEIFKFISLRDRPQVNNAQGNFFSSSPTQSSFPSVHSAAAWSMASVIGSEYPGWITRAAVYGLAATVSVSRIVSEQHFPSDVLVGSATGWLIGHYVYHAHHNFNFNIYNPPMPWEQGAPRTQAKSSVPSTIHLPSNPNPGLASASIPSTFHPLAPDVDPDTIGSTNVPMDSWIYPALERLGAMGFIPTQSVSIRPWTRQECLRQLQEAEDLATSPEKFSPSLIAQANLMMADLRKELASEPRAYEALSLESLYTRYGTIAGPALADSYHFGQTWWNDFGRPLGRGSSLIAGYSVRAHYGRLFFYDRQEFQHGPGQIAYSPQLLQLISDLDGTPLQTHPATPAINRQRLIELYGGLAFAGNALSFGKQELYWGPSNMGPLSFSSNAVPTYSLRFDATRPHPFPFFPSIGTYRFDFVLGKLSGHKYPARPWFNGQKVDFNFGDNLEISFTRWSIFWGVGHPITIHSFIQNVFSFNSTGNGAGGGSGNYGDRTDPGDRKSNFDFRWHLPFLRKVVTLYADSYSDDDPSPIDAPRRAVWDPGIYFARLPWLPHMDLRVEAVSSIGLAEDFGGNHFFFNNQYLDANTNQSFMLGNAVGRDARAIEARSKYWFSARTQVEAGYRQTKGGTQFLPGGGTITDAFATGSYALNSHWTANAFTQYERFLIPSYMPGAQHNVSGWLQLTWNPDLHYRR